jgi:ABC-2 type transport system permease protein
MNGLWPVLKRELFSLFVTPTAWVVGTAFLLLQGLHFYLIVAHFAAQPDLSAEAGPVETFFGQTILLYLPVLFVCPVLTMRLFAEERRSGTIEPLLTAPVDTVGIVLGKYLAVLLTYLALWLPTVVYMLLLSRWGAVDWRVVAAGYLAVGCVGAGCLSLGTLASALSRSQLSAAVMSGLAILGLFMFGIGEFIFEPGAGYDLSAYVSVWGQMNDFSRGLIDSRRLVFDATLVLLPLFVTVRAVDAWRLE